MKKQLTCILLSLFIITASILFAMPVFPATGAGTPLKATRPSSMTEAQSERLRSRIYSAVRALSTEVSIADLMISTDVSQSELDAYVVELVTQHPDVFYFRPGMSQYAFKSGEFWNKIKLYYRYFIDDIEPKRAALEAKVQEALTWIPSGATELEKIKALHDYVVKNVTYWSGDTRNAPRTAYQALVKGTDVCEGYSLSLMLLLSRVGVETQWLSNTEHSWLKVRLNGNWYHVDPTWADQPGGVWNKVFLKSDDFYRTKLPLDTHDVWKQAGPACTDTTYDKYTGYDNCAAWITYSGPAGKTDAAGFDLSHSSLTLSENGGIAQLKVLNVTPSDADAARAQFSSSDMGVAIVTNTGVVTARSSGSAVITCDLDGVIRTCSVTVAEDANDFSNTPYYRLYVSNNSFVFNGEARKPEVTLERTYDGTTVTLKEGRDYKVRWPSDMVNRGRKDFYVIGIGEYQGGIKGTYTISQASLSSAVVTIEDQTYTGSRLTPPVRVVMDGILLVENIDYYLYYGANINVGRASVSVRGTGNYSGNATGSFLIKEPLPAGPVSVTGVKLNAASTRMLAEGSALLPGQKEAAITLSATVLPENADNRKVKWSTSDRNVATVDSAGKVTGLKAGTVTITVTTVDGGRKASCKVQVLTRKEYKLKDGAKYKFSSRLNKNFSLDVMYMNYHTNTNVSLFRTTAGRGAQVFTVEGRKVNGHMNWMLTRPNKTVKKRAVTELKDKNLVFGTCKETNWQLFRAYRFNDGSLQFINRGSGNAIALDGGKAEQRVNVRPKKADLDPAQRWYATN